MSVIINPSAASAAIGIGTPIVGGTPGSVLFIDSGGNLGQDNAKFFWDDTGFSLKLKSGSTLALGGSSSGTITVATQAAAGTWTLTLPTTAGTNLYVLQTDGTGITTWVPQSGGGGGMAIGGAVSGGTTGSVLFIGAGPVLAQDNTNFFWDDTNFFLKLGHAGTMAALYIDGLPAIYSVPNVSGNNWFEGNAGNTTLTGHQNFGTGDSCLGALTTGIGNCALGAQALFSCTTGSNNMAVGFNSLLNLIDGNNNMSVGTGALSNSAHGSDNCAVGVSALGIVGNAGGSGSSNTAIGTSAGLGVTTCNLSVFVGFSSGPTSGNSQHNIMVGANAGTSLSGSTLGNTFLGGNVGFQVGANSQNNIFMGYFSGFNISGTCTDNTLIGGWRGPSHSISEVIALSTGNNSGADPQALDWNYITSNVWSMSFGTTAQGLHIYKTWDGAVAPVNYERGAIDWNLTSNVFRLASQAGGTGVVRLIAIDGFQKAGAPAAGDLPSGTWGVINDTSGGNTWLVYNNAGTIRKVQLV